MTHAFLTSHWNRSLWDFHLIEFVRRYEKTQWTFSVMIFFLLKTIQHVETKVNTTTCSKVRAERALRWDGELSVGFCFETGNTLTNGLLIEELSRRGGIRTQRSVVLLETLPYQPDGDYLNSMQTNRNNHILLLFCLCCF